MARLLEVAIGLVFAFTLVSLAASMVNEWVSALLAQRSKHLFRGLVMLFGDAAKAADVWQHPLVRSLAAPPNRWLPGLKTRERHPSYIPSATFVQTLVTLLVPPPAPAGPVAPPPAPPLSFNDVRNAVVALPPGPTRESLLALLQDADGKLDVFKAKITDWFDAAMERVSGQYKRWSQRWLFLIGLLIALVAGVDTIHVARVLWVDDALRQVVVAEAKLAVDKAEQARAAQQQVDAAASAAASGSATPPAPSATKTQARPEDVAKKLEDARQQVQAIGRTALPLVPPTLWGEAGWKYLWHVPGFLLTALAACLGAPFWFDVLNKAINLRLAGTATPKEK